MDTMPLNPWFSMWLHPRRTIRQIVETNPEHLVLSLAAVGGFIEGLTNMASDSKGDDMSLRAILLATLIVGPIMGIVGLWVGGFLLRWTGGWIGGQADSRRIRATLAWANVPLVWSLLLWIPAILLFGLELFTEATPVLDASAQLAGLHLVFSVGIGIISLWSFVAFLHALGEVQGFSAWRSLLNSFLALLVFLVPLFAFIGIAIWASR